MRKSLVAFALVISTVTPAVSLAQMAPMATPAATPLSDHTFTGNVGLFSEYRFRGISQTFAKPAIQGGFDYSHASGVYLGNWNSNINSGAGFPAGNIEMDFYGGWKKSWGDWGLDVGFMYYYYPGTDANAASGTTIVNPKTGGIHNGKVDNKEIYVGGSWKWLSAKYYYSVGDYFSLPGTKGSNYLDVSATYDMGDGWGLVGHIGSFRLKNWSTGTDATHANYSDWKLGVTKDLGEWIFGASYINTNSKGSCNLANPGFYCFANTAPVNASSKFKDAGKGVVVVSVSKSF